ncbi:hypothetical protein OK016_13180 [Vibrio chagasii]|nr:hypothetical protein [Vibrio chagasii]
MLPAYGHYADDQHSDEAPGDVLLARSLEEGAIGCIIGGRSPKTVCMEGNEYADFNPG